MERIITMREKGTWKRFHHVDEKDISQYKELHRENNSCTKAWI